MYSKSSSLRRSISAIGSSADANTEADADVDDASDASVPVAALESEPVAAPESVAVAVAVAVPVVDAAPIPAAAAFGTTRARKPSSFICAALRNVESANAMPACTHAATAKVSDEVACRVLWQEWKILSRPTQ